MARGIILILIRFRLISAPLILRLLLGSRLETGLSTEGSERIHCLRLLLHGLLLSHVLLLVHLSELLLGLRLRLAHSEGSEGISSLNLLSLRCRLVKVESGLECLLLLLRLGLGRVGVSIEA